MGVVILESFNPKLNHIILKRYNIFGIKIVVNIKNINV